MTTKRRPKEVEEAERLVKKAYTALRIKLGPQAALAALANVATKATASDQTIWIPVTMGHLKKHIARNKGPKPSKRMAADYLGSLFEQRENLAMKSLEGVREWHENDVGSFVVVDTDY